MVADAHTHLDHYPESELAGVLDRARDAGVELVVTVGMDPEMSAAGAAIAADQPDVFAAVGLHPWMAQDYPTGAPLDELENLAARPGVVAVGEIGLDFVRNIWRDLSYQDPALRRMQETVFREQLRLARERGLPVILHSRGAHDAVTRILREEEMATVGGCVQLLEGTPEDVRRYTELGFFFTLGSSVTFPDPGGWHETVRAIPPDRLLLETDAPWLPLSGSESDRSFPHEVTRIGEAVARIRGTDPETVFAGSVSNLHAAIPRIAGDG